VVAAYAGYDPRNPQSFGKVAAARLAAQENLGIDPEYRSPITKNEALALTEPLDVALPGQEAKVLGDTAAKFRDMFGAQAPQALAYALRARKVHGEVAQQAASVFGKLTRGEPLTREEAQQFDQAQETAASQAALDATRGAPSNQAVARKPMSGQDVLRRIGNPGEEGNEPSTISEKPAPPPRAIEYLLRNRETSADFDKMYGTGMAKEILSKYPLAGAP
jgi:hypothetical protein